MHRADVDAGQAGAEQRRAAELARLRRENGMQAMEIEIVKRASAYFAPENVLPGGRDPNNVPAGTGARRRRDRRRGDLPVA